jgi:hypothetical protein
VIALYRTAIAGYVVVGITTIWLPSYLELAKGYSAAAAGRWFTIVILLVMPLQILVSMLSQRLLRRGMSRRRDARQHAQRRTGGERAAQDRTRPVSADAGAQDHRHRRLDRSERRRDCPCPVMLAEVVPLRQQAVLIALFTATGNNRRGDRGKSPWDGNGGLRGLVHRSLTG